MNNKKKATALKVVFIAPTEFVEHPQHAKFFLEADKKKKSNTYHDSISKFGKVKQVVYVEKDGQKLVIDGWGYVLYARQMNIPLVAACPLNLTNDKDIARIMLELQFSDHCTPAEEYKIYSAAVELYSKGQGSRNDLADDDDFIGSEPEDPTGKKKRRPTVHDKIAAITNASSAKRVQYILKIGAVNSSYLERMESENLSAYSAYLKCISEEKGIKPKPHKNKKAAIEGDPNDITRIKPPFPTKEELNNSFNIIVAQALKENKLSVINKPDLNVMEDEDCYWVLSKCPKCSTPVKVVLPKQILQHI